MTSNVNPHITDDGIWLSLTGEASPAPAPALFLDRDGVIIGDTGYMDDPADVRLLPSAAMMIRRANQAGIPVVVATNQSGIARGLFSWDDFAAVQRRMTGLLESEGAWLEAVAACPFHPDFTPGYNDSHAGWRKPGPRMLTTLAERLNLDSARSWMVGDKATDMEAARAAGLAGGILVGGDEAQGDEDFEVFGANDIGGATDILVECLANYSN